MPCRLREQIAALHTDTATPGCVHLLLDRLMALWPAEYYTRTYVRKTVGTWFVDLVMFRGVVVYLESGNYYLILPRRYRIENHSPDDVIAIMREGLARSM